jgi:archaellum component FlaF (FlaF/FlaG flagellin family)
MPPEVRVTESSNGKRIIITTPKGEVVINVTKSEVLIHTEYMSQLDMAVFLEGNTVYAEDHGPLRRWIEFKTEVKS